ncbi:MAG: hypothetical protein V1819_01115 [bacterium]
MEEWKTGMYKQLEGYTPEEAFKACLSLGWFSSNKDSLAYEIAETNHLDQIKLAKEFCVDNLYRTPHQVEAVARDYSLDLPPLVKKAFGVLCKNTEESAEKILMLDSIYPQILNKKTRKNNAILHFEKALNRQDYYHAFCILQEYSLGNEHIKKWIEKYLQQEIQKKIRNFIWNLEPAIDVQKKNDFTITLRPKFRKFFLSLEYDEVCRKILSKNKRGIIKVTYSNPDQRDTFLLEVYNLLKEKGPRLALSFAINPLIDSPWLIQKAEDNFLEEIIFDLCPLTQMPYCWTKRKCDDSPGFYLLKPPTERLGDLLSGQLSMLLKKRL